MKVLILCVDRDDDLGRKTSIKGPVIGKKAVLNAAVELLRKDPSETDANAIFAGLKLFDEIKEEKEIAVLTGSAKVGYESDIEIKKQLESVLKKFDADGVILVSDGKEDEMILPVIESRIPILSVHRIVVHSGQELKGFYYTLLNFLKRSTEDKELAKIVFGVPGAVALTYAFLGQQGWRLLAGVLGIYLIIRGLGMEEGLEKFASYVKNSFFSLSISFFLYLLSFILGIMGLVKASSVSGLTVKEIVAKIIYQSFAPFFYSAILLTLGIAIDSWPDRKKVVQIIGMSVSLGVSMLVLRNLSNWLLDPTYPLSYIITTAVWGSIVVIIIKLIERVIV